LSLVRLALKEHGRNWTKIKEKISTRTKIQIRSHALRCKKFSKELKKPFKTLLSSVFNEQDKRKEDEKREEPEKKEEKMVINVTDEEKRLDILDNYVKSITTQIEIEKEINNWMTQTYNIGRLQAQCASIDWELRGMMSKILSSIYSLRR